MEVEIKKKNKNLSQTKQIIIRRIETKFEKLKKLKGDELKMDFKFINCLKKLFQILKNGIEKNIHLKN